MVITENQQSNIFEVYVYFDPRKKGEYIVNGKVYNMQPVYVGKGNIAQRRRLKHLKPNRFSNTRLKKLNQFLLKNNISPAFETVFTTSNE